VDAEGHNVRRGDGTQASEVPGLVKDKAKEAKKEEQAGGESAYNEETGEINWDCPVSDIFLTQADISGASVMPLASANADVFPSLACSSPATITTTITTTTTIHNPQPKSAPTSQCLGGMAQGPCGEDFKAAFSCFVHSDQEPKGVDCVEKFKAMQDCFRKHPDVYGEGQ
jgi:hypothetical protein